MLDRVIREGFAREDVLEALAVDGSTWGWLTNRSAANPVASGLRRGTYLTTDVLRVLREGLADGSLRIADGRGIFTGLIALGTEAGS